MPVSSHVSSDGKVVTISVTDRFDFSLHKEFREAYRYTPGSSAKYMVDLSRTDYMDSSALGMLLLLREHAGDSSSNVVLQHVKPDIVKILKIANFDKLFTLDKAV